MVAGLLTCVGMLISAGLAAAQDGPWFSLATGSCDAPAITGEVTAGQNVLILSGGLMASVPFNYSVAPYGEASRPPWWSINETVHTDASGNVCVEAFVTAVDDYGTFLVTVRSLDANQRQYNPASQGITVIAAAAPTETPTETATAAPTETPTPEPTETPAPTQTPSATPAETQAPAPIASPTPEPTETPAPTEAPAQTLLPTSTLPPAVEPTATAQPQPSETPRPAQEPAPGSTPAQVAPPVETETHMDRRFERKQATLEALQSTSQWPSGRRSNDRSDVVSQPDTQMTLPGQPDSSNAMSSAAAATAEATLEIEPDAVAAGLAASVEHAIWLLALACLVGALMWFLGRARG